MNVGHCKGLAQVKDSQIWMTEFKCSVQVRIADRNKFFKERAFACELFEKLFDFGS